VVVKIIALVLPLGLDTFAASAALGIGGLSTRERMRASLLFTAFEAAMPLVGLAIGRELENAIGTAADYVAIGVLLALAIHLLVGGEDRMEPGSLLGRGIPASIVLGLSISLDELAIGFTLGLLRVPLVPVFALIALQAFIAAQVGMRVGQRIGQRVPERAEHVAGVVLAVLAGGVLVAKLAG
jgi:putative Mn2+ efflux pump MntP